MPSILRIAISLALLATTTNAASLGKECDSNRDCSDGATCVAGDSETSVQRCVAGAPCGGSNLGACPGDETSGQLACIWRPDKGCSSNPNGCTSIGNQFGIYKCISLDRCDSYFSGQCSGSCKINGKQCNGRGTCLLSGNSTSNKPAFECECESGWNGKLCDNVKDDTCVVDAGHCGDHGTCVKNACVCSGGYTGEQCQIPPKTNSSSGSMGDTPSNKTKSPVPSPSASNSSASRANSNNIVVTDKSKSGGPSALVIILGILAALILVVAVMFMFVARKRRREQEAANAGEFNRTDSAMVPEAGRPPTPKTKIVIM